MENISKQVLRPDITLDDLNKMNKGSMGEFLNIIYEEIGPDYLVASMPVNERTTQPMGILHGGASVVLAETLGSVAANCVIDMKQSYAVGLDINANHIRSATKGRVKGITKPIHIGGKTQVWEIKIYDEEQHLICISRITMAVIQRKDAFTAKMESFDVKAK